MAVQTVRLAAIGDMAVRERPATRPGGLEGRRLGAYRLLEAVGAGAHATVYRARHELLGIERAVKVLRGAAAGPSQRAQFIREARIAASVRHANVVSI